MVFAAPLGAIASSVLTVRKAFAPRRTAAGETAAASTRGAARSSTTRAVSVLEA